MVSRKLQAQALAAASAALVACALIGMVWATQIRKPTSMMQYIAIPMAPRLFTMPGGMPGTGFSGRGSNEEDYTDPYGGGDKPGPYGYVNDPYDGDWALGPLGGKAVGVQGLRMAPAPDQDRNLWGSEDMGTNSIFMGKMTPKDVQFSNQQRENRMKAMRPPQQVMKGHSGKSYIDPKADWIGTNSAFFGANGGGYGLAQKNKQQKGMLHKKQAHQLKAKIQGQKAKVQAKKVAKKAPFQKLFRSDDPHMAEYGFEGPNQLNDDVLPSAVGTGGPVIGVDGEPSNVDHAWVHYPEEFSFACNPDILGCDEGLTVEPEYAED
mmetsp:Transcript_16157/g.25078  ORF Transcript_16157/g.25078 Transcript_16157/m.25078 type:complete len:321 (+) Transcript_16157:3-965(+)